MKRKTGLLNKCLFYFYLYIHISFMGNQYQDYAQHRLIRAYEPVSIKTLVSV
jgi:hypothetical protein